MSHMYKKIFMIFYRTVFHNNFIFISGYNLPWETEYKYPTNFASPLQICIEASSGASDYGNKFGEPLIAGFARSFAMELSDRERHEWIKPIMFSGGIGSIEGEHVNKSRPSVGKVESLISSHIIYHVCEWIYLFSHFPIIFYNVYMSESVYCFYFL